MDNPTMEYEHGFCAWLERYIVLLRQGRVSEIDTKNTADELESMGKGQQRKLNKHLKILSVYLLK